MTIPNHLFIAILSLSISIPSFALSVRPFNCNSDNNAQAQFTQGQIYLDQNKIVHAKDCLQKAAEKGHAGAQNKLAVLLLKQNRPDDVILAKYWLQQSAKQGFAKAELNLGLVYLDASDPNIPTDLNATQALHLFKRAAAQKLPEAQYQLGQWYFDAQDYPRAKKYFALAAKQNNADALMRMGEMYYTKGTANVFDNKPNLSLATQYFHQAAAQNQAEAHYYLGIITIMESVEAPNLSNALSHFQKACIAGEREACPWQKDIEKDPVAFQKSFNQSH